MLLDLKVTECSGKMSLLAQTEGGVMQQDNGPVTMETDTSVHL